MCKNSDMKQKTCDGQKDPLMRSFEFTFSYILCRESVKFQTEIFLYQTHRNEYNVHELSMPCQITKRVTSTDSFAFIRTYNNQTRWWCTGIRPVLVSWLIHFRPKCVHVIQLVFLFPLQNYAS